MADITLQALRCEYQRDPLGIGTEAPRLSWQLASAVRGAGQTAYQILAATAPELLAKGLGDLWDSGRVEAPDRVHLPYAGRPLRSRQRVYWTVRSWDRQGEATPFAAPAVFEMGLLSAQDWQARWLGAGDPACESPLFRKAFALSHPVCRARAYVCGLGYYELRLNGRKVGDHVLDPNWTDFDQRELRDLIYPFADATRKRVPYVTYDITEALRPGENVVGLWLGNGWYHEHGRNIEGKMWYDTPRGRVQIEVERQDGTRMILASDGTWRWAPSPIIRNNVYFGETYDARLEQPGWDAPGFEDSAWAPATEVRAPAGALCPQMAPPDKVMQTRPPVGRTEPRPGVHVFDFGQNASGWVRLRVQGPAGTEVRLRFAEERHPDGTLDFISAGGNEQIQEDVYILRGTGMETYAPRFTWHGFRYAEVTGYPGTLDPHAVTYEVVHSAVADTGRFSCSHEMLNRLYQAFRWTQLANYHGAVPSDCPHRERLGYTGDGHLTTESAMLCFDVAPLYAKWLQDMADAQHAQSGFVPHTAPFYGGGGGHAWGAAYPIVAWLHYRYYGDHGILERHYAGLQAWLRYLAGCTDERGLVVREEPGSWCLGDWSLPGVIALPENVALRPELVNTAYAGLCARLLARIANALGKTEDAAAAVAQAERFALAVHTGFYDAGQGCYRPGCHGAEAFAWACGAIPAAELPRVTAHVLQHLRGRDDHLDTGILGTPLLLDFLTATGHTETAYRLMTQTTEPGFGHMLARGATTLWENWAWENGSHCHPMYGSVVAWMVKTLAGLQPEADTPGLAHLRIHPHPVGDLTHAAASLDTIHGHAAVSWQRTDGTFSIQVVVPHGTRATVILPADDPSAARVDESDRPFWKAGATLSGSPGIESVRVAAKALHIDVAGGTYRFILHERRRDTAAQ